MLRREAAKYPQAKERGHAPTDSQQESFPAEDGLAVQEESVCTSSLSFLYAIAQAPRDAETGLLCSPFVRDQCLRERSMGV